MGERMMWMMIFCAWAVKSGGCITPIALPSKRACEFVLKHQIDEARRREREWHNDGMVINGRCIGVRP
jgi:hypothetical protein